MSLHVLNMHTLTDPHTSDKSNNSAEQYRRRQSLTVLTSQKYCDGPLWLSTLTWVTKTQNGKPQVSQCVFTVNIVLEICSTKRKKWALTDKWQEMKMSAAIATKEKPASACCGFNINEHQTFAHWCFQCFCWQGMHTCISRKCINPGMHTLYLRSVGLNVQREG